jgi:Fe-S-cluster containining protein
VDDYEAAKQKSIDNWKKIISQITPEFDIKEEVLFKSLTHNKKPAMWQLEDLYGYMNELFAAISKHAPCRKGCADCCRMTILVSPLEAQYIESKTGIKRNQSTAAAVPEETPCPFLENDVCSIYQYRPYVCRNHLALHDDPKWCLPGPAHSLVFALFSRMKLKMCYNYILMSHNSQSWEDIRLVFQRSQSSLKSNPR